MELQKNRKGIVGMVLTLAFVFGFGIFLATPTQAQWGGWGQWGRDRWEQQRERERQRREEEQRRRNAERYRYDQRNYPYGNGGYYGGYGNNRGYGSYGLSNYGRQVAQQRGYQTGLDRGGDDARAGRSPNPNNSDHYRDGDSGYNSSFGNRDAYRQVYRDAFLRGYDQAYRQNGRYRRW